MFASALDFLKLEKVELGGCRGKVLSEMVYSMNEDFHDSWRTLRESKYDPLDYTKKVTFNCSPHCLYINIYPPPPPLGAITMPRLLSKSEMFFRERDSLYASGETGAALFLPEHCL